MILHTVDISTFTSSFRHPMLVSGTQLTLDVPPVSTVLGLINAAAGKYIHYSSSQIGYYFEYEGKTVDVETIYQNEVNKKGKLQATTRSNVVRRELLFDTFLRIYSPDEKLIDYFRSPVYPILLGRSSDLATVDAKSFKRKELSVSEKAEKISGQLIPYAKAALPGRIQALAKYYTDTSTKIIYEQIEPNVAVARVYPSSNSRQMLGKEPYVVIDCNSMVGGAITTYRDTIREREVDIYLHEIDSRLF